MSLKLGDEMKTTVTYEGKEVEVKLTDTNHEQWGAIYTDENGIE